MCGVCGTSFAYKEILRKHISTIHKKKCLKCGKLVSNLKSHTKKKHSSETNFEKNIPEIQNEVNENTKKFSKTTRRGLVRIKKNLNLSKKSHECIVCGIRFAYKVILNRHITTFHKGRPCQCLKCGKMVFDLKLHSKNKHPKGTNFDENNPKVEDEVEKNTIGNPKKVLDNSNELPFLKKVQGRSEETKLKVPLIEVDIKPKIEADIKPKIEADIKPKLKPSDLSTKFINEINTGLQVISSIKAPDDQRVAKKVYVPTGKPRGRPAKAAAARAYVPTGKPRGRPGNNPVTAEIQDDNDNTKKVLDNPKELPILKKAQERPKETKFDENIPKVQEEVKENTNDNTEKVLDDPNAWAEFKKTQEDSKETKFNENIPKVQDEVNKSINENIKKVLDNPNDNPLACIPLLKKAQELLKKYEDYEVKYYCNICPDFSTIDPSTLIEHHCSFHEIVDAEKFPGKFSKSNNM